jgi:hypothetical protein
MTRFDRRNLFGVQFAPETALLAPRVTSQGGFVVDARSSTPGRDPRGWHERWLLPDREALHDIWEYARDRGFRFEILDFRPGDLSASGQLGSRALTDEQRQALRVAHEEGYFSEPREASLETLAEALDISPSAVGGRLRRGMKSLVGSTLVVDGDRDDPR